jgi:hypothetical protein
MAPESEYVPNRPCPQCGEPVGPEDCVCPHCSAIVGAAADQPDQPSPPDGPVPQDEWLDRILEDYD